MPEPRRTELTVRRERVLLVGALEERERSEVDALSELEALAKTARAEVVGRVQQVLRSVNPATYIGHGKAEEVRDLAKARDADVVIFDTDLTPTQLRTLEEVIDRKVVDRSELILDIFATHARSRQAKLQVELAQLEYTYPRLRKMWSHLSRYKGGIGSRGPGETQLESDRRLARSRIADLKAELSRIEGRKSREVESRYAEFTVSIVGYTNAGKSTLMNALTGAGVLVEDALFATLDTRTRRWKIGPGAEALLSDTVGFIRKLPHHLVECFKATLEEATHADLLLHVVDVSQPDAIEQADAVMGVLDAIGCKDSRTLTVFNKMDAMTDPAALHVLAGRFPESVTISALERAGLDELTALVSRERDRDMMELVVSFPPANGRLGAFLHQNGTVIERLDESDVARVRVKLHRRWLPRLSEYGAASVEPVSARKSPRKKRKQT